MSRCFVGPVAMAFLLPALVATADDALTDRQKRDLRDLGHHLAKAQRAGDEKEVARIVAKAAALLGDAAGVPETPDVFRKPPKVVAALTAAERAGGFQPILDRLPKAKWWKRNLDPTKQARPAREVATVVFGGLAAHRAGLKGAKEALAEARAAGDYLLWSQAEAASGVIPFPAVRNGKGRPFEVAEVAMRRMEKAGTLKDHLRKGWVVGDLGDPGGLQFDNGEAGVALLELYEATKDAKYLAGAHAAGKWAVVQPVVPNWNYNSFSVWLLADLFRVTGDKVYLESAKRKARLGVLPGQLTAGKHKGRWLDPHNAVPSYHYIMVRSLVSLLAVLPPKDADRPRVLSALRLALQARNGDIVDKGVLNKDKAMEALLLVARWPGARKELADCQTDEALAVLERLVVAEYRAGKLPLAPSTWGRYLEHAAGRAGGKK